MNLHAQETAEHLSHRLRAAGNLAASSPGPARQRSIGRSGLRRLGDHDRGQLGGVLVRADQRRRPPFDHLADDLADADEGSEAELPTMPAMG